MKGEEIIKGVSRVTLEFLCLNNGKIFYLFMNEAKLKFQ